MSKYLELVEGSFTQEHLDKQKNQKPYVAYSIKDNKVIYTIIPKEEGTMYTVYRVVKKDVPSLEYNAIDLGLPSGILWADRNVGATSVEDCGSYFSWGGTEGFTLDGKYEITKNELTENIWNIFVEKFSFGEITSKEQLKQLFLEEFGMELTDDNVIDMYFFLLNEEVELNSTDLAEECGFGLVIDGKFNWESYFDTDKESGYDENGFPISFKKYHMGENGLTILAPENDAATIHMGSEWRIPTKEDFEELVNNTTQTFIDIQGNEHSKEEAQSGTILDGKLKGVKLTSSNGNSIFIPTAGYCTGNEYFNHHILSLWSSTLIDDSACIILGTTRNYMYDVQTWGTERCSGNSIRGVQA